MNEKTSVDNITEIKELFYILKKQKKIIFLISTFFVIFALLYVLLATPWFKVNVTLEIGKYKEPKNGNEIYLEQGSEVAERLKVKYIDINKHLVDRESKISTISASKKSPQFIAISALGKSNKLAVQEIGVLVNDLRAKHQKVIDEIIIQKQAQLDRIDRKIYELQNFKITNTQEEIVYIKKVQLQAIDKKIVSIKSDLKDSIAQREAATLNLTTLKNEPSLIALRLAEIQGLKYKISENELKLITLDEEKQKIISNVLPTLSRVLEKLKKIDLIELETEHKLIESSMKQHNYHNTEIVGKIVIQDKPIKPKKILIIFISLIMGIFFSIFSIFFLEFFKSVRVEENTK